MSNEDGEHRPAGQGPPAELANRLGYLLKHAQVRLAELTTAALAPYGITGRELAVLLVLADGEPASQQQAAGRLGIDRTSMVAFLDMLEGKGLVARRTDANDRRRNVVELTAAGRDTLDKATRASGEAEREFLAALTRPAADQLRRTLARLVGPAPRSVDTRSVDTRSVDTAGQPGRSISTYPPERQ